MIGYPLRRTIRLYAACPPRETRSCEGARLGPSTSRPAPRWAAAASVDLLATGYKRHPKRRDPVLYLLQASRGVPPRPYETGVWGVVQDELVALHGRVR